ncbi:hypothetical protein [Bacillus sp. NTK034]|uniref:hypothetical protein n=1 Tax=Bacillus sp. NTK034 TaxID=2802176 RepID=UPI001A8D23B0|nr:hypothetical protein [Bacillus sp. NTK034]MBN8203481.1 hypothetical protein [Bacillus sp. NTK034]
MLFELDVIDAVCEDLEERGYVIINRKAEMKHSGKDVIAKKTNSNKDIRLFIEAIGETSSDSSSNRYGKPFERGQIKVHISELLFGTAETLSMPKLDEYMYKTAIAIPDNKDHREFINKIKPFLGSIDIAVFFVKGSKVSEIISNWEV